MMVRNFGRIGLVALLWAIQGVNVSNGCSEDSVPHEKTYWEESMEYFSEYKYELGADYEYLLSFDACTEAKLKGIVLKGRTLILEKGFQWDGASGPAIDTKNMLRGSAIHDALGLLMTRGLLDSRYKTEVDREFIQILESDGVPWLRRYYVHKAVKCVGPHSPSARNNEQSKTLALKVYVRRSLQCIARLGKVALSGEKIGASNHRTITLSLPCL